MSTGARKTVNLASRAACGTLLVAMIAILAMSPAAFAQNGTPKEFPGCEAWKGPGYFAHPEFPLTCCWPGYIPVPGQPVCVKPGSPAYYKYFGGGPAAAGDGTRGTPSSAGTGGAPASNGTNGNPGGPQIFDAEGRPGAPGEHCIPFGGSCTLGGASCCSGTCQGTFPNTVCQ